MDFKTREINDIVIYDIEWEFKVVEAKSVVLQDDVKSHLRSGRRHFVFNLAGVKYMDSNGLGEIVASFISIGKLGGKLKLTNLLPKISLMFETTGLEKVFEIADDEETAIENFSAENQS